MSLTEFQNSPKRKRQQASAPHKKGTGNGIGLNQLENKYKEYHQIQIGQDEDDDQLLSDITTTSTVMKRSPFSNCLNSTFHSGKTSHADSMNDSFYSHEEANVLVGKFEATPFKRNLYSPEVGSGVDPNESFVSQMSSPRSPPNFYQIAENNKCDEISPVRPENEKEMCAPTFIYQPRMRPAMTRSLSPSQFEMNSNKTVSSPCFIPHRSISPVDLKSKYEKRKKSYSTQQDITGVDLTEDNQSQEFAEDTKLNCANYDDFGLKLIPDEYCSLSSSLSSTEDADFAPSIEKSMKKLSKTLPMTSSSVSVLRTCPDSPNSNQMTSRTLFCEATPEKNYFKRDKTGEDEVDGLLLHYYNSPLTTAQNSPKLSKLQTNQHNDRLETSKERFPQTPTSKSYEIQSGSRLRKQRVKSLPPSTPQEIYNLWHSPKSSISLHRAHSHNRVTSNVESAPLPSHQSPPTANINKAQTPSRPPVARPHYASSSPDRLTSQSFTPSVEAIIFPYHLLHSPQSPETTSIGAYGYQSNSKDNLNVIKDLWTECKSLFPLDDVEPLVAGIPRERRQSLTPPRVGKSPMLFLKNREASISTPDKRSVRSNSGDNYPLRSPDSNIGKRSRSPLSSAAPSPTEQHQNQHKKIVNDESMSSSSSICSGITNQMNNTSISTSGIIPRPLPDQSVFEISRTNSFHSTHSPICPPTPARTPQYLVQGDDGDFGIKIHANYDEMFLRTTESNEFDSPRPHIVRQNSLEENKLLMTSEPSPLAHIDISDGNKEHNMSPNFIQNESDFSESTTLTIQEGSHETSNSHDATHPTNILFYRDFVNEGLMGSGTFAEVFRVCLKSDPEKKFAIKKCRKKFRNKTERENLLDEVRIMKLIGHSATKCQNILQFYNAWQEDSYFYVQLELAERGTLRDLMNLYSHKKTILPHLDIVNIFYQITSGLKHIHSYSIVHLDIKPQNILITADGTLKIGDFGIAMHEGPDGDELHEGDARYLPEELLNSSYRDHTADIFSLGLSIYEICSVPQLDILPYEGQLWHDLRSGNLIDLTRPENGSRSPELFQLILSCIQSSPSLRPTAEGILLCPIFNGGNFQSTKSVLCEPPLRAPSPAIFHTSSYPICSHHHVHDLPIVATPTSSSGVSTWHRMTSPYMFNSNANQESTPVNDNILLVPPTRLKTPGVDENTYYPYTPTMLSETTLPLSEFYKTTPRHFLSHDQLFYDTSTSDEISNQVIPAQPPHSQFTCLTDRRITPHISLSPSYESESIQTPTTRNGIHSVPSTPLSLQIPDSLSATPVTTRKHGKNPGLIRKKK